MKLTNVARASLSDELAKDYKSFLIQRGLRLWPKDSPEALAMRERLRHDTPPGLAGFVAGADPESAANAMLCAVNQAAYLLRRQIQSQGKDFIEQGGFTERLHATRTRARTEAQPACPLCGKKMQRRTAKKGPHAGQSFWGCAGYPECTGIVSIPTDVGPVRQV
jgi:four helix bundle suffix protein